MIEIISNTKEERIIKLLQKTYPITILDIKKELNLSELNIKRILDKFLKKDIVQLDVLPDKTFVRLIRNDFSFIGRKNQKKFIKHSKGKRQKTKEYDGIMYS